MIIRDLVKLISTLQSLYLRSNGAIEAVEATRERRLRTLLAHAKANSPFYAARLAGIDVARCALSDLPTLTKVEMMQNFDALVTDRAIRKDAIADFIADKNNLGKLYLGRYGVSHTSGSQGNPALIVQDEDARMLTVAVRSTRGVKLRRGRLSNVHRLWSPARMAVLILNPGFYPSAAAFTSVPAVLRRMLRVELLSMLDGAAVNCRKLRTFKPEYIIGYASALEALAREEEEGRLGLGAMGCLSHISSVSEPLPETSRARIEKAFGVHVADEYAMGECMALSCGCLAGTGSHLNADLAILEVVDAQGRPVPRGTQGSKVLVTNLYNHVQPFIRYEIDDRVTIGAAPCACGSPLPHIQSVTGRAKDTLWVESAGRVRELPAYVFLAALNYVLDLAEHQIVQTAPNTFLLRLAPLPGRTLDAENVRERVMQSARTEGFDGVVSISVDIVPEIARGPSGKAVRVKQEYAPMPA